MEESREAYRDALRAEERHLELHPDDVRAVYMGSNALCELGERPQPRMGCSRIIDGSGGSFGSLQRVLRLLPLGERTRPSDCLEKAVDQGLGSQILD